MSKCSYCSSGKNLSVDLISTTKSNTKGYVCQKCNDKLDESLVMYEAMGRTRADWKKEVIDVTLKEEATRLKNIKKARKTLRLPSSHPKKCKGAMVVSLNTRVKEYLCSYKCKRCNMIGTLESNGGDMIPINGKIKEEQLYDDKNKLEVPFGIRFSNWEFTLCKPCLKIIKEKN